MPGPPTIAYDRPLVAPLHFRGGRREHPQRRQRVHARVQRHPQAACLHHVAECRLTRAAVVEMQEQRRGRPAEAAITDADVEDRAGRLGQTVPDAGLLQQAA